MTERFPRRVIFDTSTLVSAALRPGSIPHQAQLLATRFCELCASQQTLDELREVSTREKFKSYLAQSERQDFVRLVENSVRLFVVRPDDLSSLAPPCRDPNDNKFLALALEAEAEGIVSSDQDLLALDPWNEVRILRPSHFVDEMTRDV